MININFSTLIAAESPKRETRRGQNPMPLAAGAIFGVIGGGSDNTIDDNTAGTSYGVIGGGQLNYIGSGTNHSSIIGGNGNTVAGSCSSILGGAGNSDSGAPFAGIYANAFAVTPALNDPATLGVPSAFFADELVVVNMPFYTGIGPLPVLAGSKALYYAVVGGACQVFIA